MTIKPRIFPSDKESKGRHPMLKLGSIYFRIYQFIKSNPNCTRQDIKDGLIITLAQVSKRTSELKNEGLVQETGHTKCLVTNRRVATLAVTEGRAVGNPRQREKFIVQLWQDVATGQYCRKFKDGDEKYEYGLKLIAEKVVIFNIAKPSENLQPLQTSATKKLIIDGDFTTIEG